MEDPITFDLWGRSDGQHREDVLKTLSRTRPESARRELVREVAASVTADHWVLIAQDMSWATVQSMKDDIAADATVVFDEVCVFQCGYAPPDRSKMGRCRVHQLYYGGVLGCPVCEGRALAEGSPKNPIGRWHPHYDPHDR